MAENTLPFPLEVLNDIFCYFVKNELKVLRLVCKQFERAGSQLLFDQVIISNNFACLGIAKAIIGSFSSSIKKIVFCPVFYLNLTQEQYYQRKMRRAGRHSENQLAVRQHLEKAYTSHCKLVSEQQEILENGECLAILSIALKTSNKARTLVFGAPRGQPGVWERDTQRYGISSEDLCPSSGCTMGPFFHSGLSVEPVSRYRRPLNEMWYPAMIALSASDSQISEIDISNPNPMGWIHSMSITAFDSTRHQIKHVRTRLEVLAKLHLEIGLLPEERASPAEQACYDRGDVAKALSTAHNLESLWLHACRPIWISNNGQNQAIENFQGSLFTPLDPFLGRCQFPRLRSLILQYFKASESDLLALLQGSPHLRSLLLSGFSLTQGSWKEFVERARETLSLKRIALHYLHGFEFDDPNDNHHFWHSPMVDRFFFGSGENPFTREAMIQHYKDDWDANHGSGAPRTHRLKWNIRRQELEDHYYGT